jgi:5'-nucleotidase
LTPEYAPKAHALFDMYHPIEINHNVGLEEKNEKMHEWWRKHFDLLIEGGLTMDVMREIVSKGDIHFRESTLEFIDCLYKKKIPLVIMSAGPGDMIEECLRQAGRLYENVHVIANLFEFNIKGDVVNIKEPIIHSLNKYETVIQKFPAFEIVKNRKNVLLLGDGLGDLGMIEGFEYDNLIKIGFLNENQEGNLEEFKKNFDVVILDDGSMDFVLDLCKEII